MSTNTTGVLLHHIGCFGDGDGDGDGDASDTLLWYKQ
jgi:hypothetical protein